MKQIFNIQFKITVNEYLKNILKSYNILQKCDVKTTVSFLSIGVSSLLFVVLFFKNTEDGTRKNVFFLLFFFFVQFSPCTR